LPWLGIIAPVTGQSPGNRLKHAGLPRTRLSMKTFFKLLTIAALGYGLRDEA
jgi:hypothetical protein